MKNVKDLQVSGKKVLVRCDFNVPLKDGVIRDDNRIVQALPTIKELIGKGARVVLMSHLGKIDWKDPVKLEAGLKKNTLEPVAVRLSELLGQDVKFSHATHGEELKASVESLKDGEVLLVQNTRFEKGETKNDVALSTEWASLVDAFVMDAFGSAHRAHSSTVGVPEILKAEGKEVAIGYLVEKEVVNLDKVVNCTERPYVAILGGFKVSDKIKVIESLMKECDKILIGGAMAYTFKKALGKEIGDSPCEVEQLDYARRCIEESNGKILLPVDFVVANSFDNPTEIITTEDDNVPAGFEGMDIGPKTIAKYKEEIHNAKTIFWNGPMGVFEKEQFTSGTVAICEACKDIKDHAFTVCGGGDSAAAVAQFGFKGDFGHVSTGGGASLEMIENDGYLPGIDVIIK